MVRTCLKKHLEELKRLSPDQLREQRYQKLRAMTIVQE
jgi:acetyl-CoA carboxylase carboxyl transferase subunit alpha